jgi:hypothetical protein
MDELFSLVRAGRLRPVVGGTTSSPGPYLLGHPRSCLAAGPAAAYGRGVSRREQDEPEVYRITSAAGSHSADMQQRAGRYLVSMGIRTLCVILVILVPGPLRWVFAVGAIVLPYIAVVAANAAGERRERPVQGPPPAAGRSLPAAPPVATVPVAEPVADPTGRRRGQPSGQPSGQGAARVPRSRSAPDRRAS